MSIIEHIIALIAPHVCVQCGVEGQLLCPPCQQGLPLLPSGCYRCNRPTKAFSMCPACQGQSALGQVVGATTYQGTARQLVRGLKFGRQQAAALVAAEVLARQLRSLDLSDVLISPLPTAPSRVRQRGYDQAVLLARHLSQLLGVPYFPALARNGSQRQVGQKRAVRLKQMHDAFRAVRPHQWQQRHLLLIDDVLTTGASLQAGAQVLRAAGAGKVSAAVFAVA